MMNLKEMRRVYMVKKDLRRCSIPKIDESYNTSLHISLRNTVRRLEFQNYDCLVNLFSE